jgi:hypothetical protein
MTEQETTAPKEQASASAADVCPECGSGLAADQRYCLNCGWRRGGARVDYESQILRSGQPAAAGAPLGTAAARGGQQWSPLLAIGAIALLGVFLLLGVLIGKKDNNTTQTVQAQAAPTTTSAAAAPTPTTASATPDKSAKGGNKAAAAGAGTAPGQGNVVQGGTGNTEGIQQADTNASPQENAKNGADVVATGGAPEKLDPNGQAGGGSGSTCIGC